MTTSGYHIRDIVEDAQVRWLKPGEVLFILQSFEEKQLTLEPPQRPPNGSLFLFNRKILRFFRNDGHSWRKKKDGRTLGEAHERLKVGNVEALNCYYAHGENNPHFQRRSYWMLNSAMEHIVLVHYRDTTLGRNNATPRSALSPGSPSTLIQSSSSYASQLTRSAAISSELYESSSSPSYLEVSSDSVIKTEGTSHLNLIGRSEPISGSPNSEIDQALRRIQDHLSVDEDQLNENSYDSGVTVDEQSYNAFKGMQGYGVKLHDYPQDSQDESTVTSQQTSFWEDMLINGIKSEEDYNFLSDKNGMLLAQPKSHPVEEQKYYNFGDNDVKNDSSMFLLQELEDLEYSSNTPARNMYQSDPNYSEMFDQKPIITPLGLDSSLTIAQEQKFTIREISPQWGYANESTKVFIIGNFPCDQSKHKLTCKFGDIKVPIEIIQEGVISCQSPPHPPGKLTVSITITSTNQQSYTEIKQFEFRSKQTNYENANSPQKESHKSLEELLLLVRLVQMLLSDQLTPKGENINLLESSIVSEDSWAHVIEALLDGSLLPFSATDWVLEQLLKDKLHQWLYKRLRGDEESSGLTKREQGIIHMVSGLGFWWALGPILSSGVSVNFRDINGWTALHWAARFGREKMVAELLASGAFSGAVTDPTKQDPNGKTPASIASTYGHKGLAGYLSEMSLTGHLSSLTLQESENSKASANLEAENTINNISKTNNIIINDDHVSLKHTLAAVRNATQAAARIQSAFRAHSFRRRQQKESNVFSFEDEYGLLESEIEGISKLTSRNGQDYNAALSIQKKYRGWKGRRDFVSLRQKVVKIQAHVRGHQVRKSYRVICWAVGMVEKIILRWRRKGSGLRGFRQEVVPINDHEEEEEDVVKAFRKQKVDVAVGEAVSRVLSMVDSQPAQKQYRRMLENYQQAKAERGDFGVETTFTSNGEVTNMENDDLY